MRVSIPSALRRRPLTYTVLAGSILATVLLMSQVREMYSFEQRFVQLGVRPPEGSRVESVDFVIEKGLHEDEVAVTVFFENRSRAGDALVLWTPKGLQPVEGLDLSDTWTTKSDSLPPITFHSFDVPDGLQFCTVVFEGEVLSGGARELDVTIATEVTSEGPPSDNVPVQLQLAGLSQADVSNLDVEPTSRGQHAIIFNPLPASQGRPELVSFVLRDRLLDQRLNYSVFVFGVLIGVFVSLFTNVTWDLVRSKEIPPT